MVSCSWKERQLEDKVVNIANLCRCLRPRNNALIIVCVTSTPSVPTHPTYPHQLLDRVHPKDNVGSERTNHRISRGNPGTSRNYSKITQRNFEVERRTIMPHRMEGTSVSELLNGNSNECRITPSTADQWLLNEIRLRLLEG